METCNEIADERYIQDKRDGKTGELVAWWSFKQRAPQNQWSYPSSSETQQLANTEEGLTATRENIRKMREAWNSKVCMRHGQPRKLGHALCEHFKTHQNIDMQFQEYFHTH